MKKLSMAILAWALLAQSAFSADKNVNAKITDVTLFLSGAQVNRKANVSVKTGRTKLIFKGLTNDLNENSITVKVEGGVKVMSINHHSDYFDPTKQDPRIKQLSDSIELMNNQLEDIVVELNLLHSRERFVLVNYRVKGDENMDPEKLVKISQFYNKELSTVRRSIKTQKRKFKKLNEVLLKYRNQLQAKLTSKPEHTSVVEVLVEAVKATTFNFTLSYIVNSAGWTPSYDIRAEDITKPLEIAYKSTFYQQTGIDWTGVKLTFSNSNPYQSNVMPKLKPHYLRYISYNARARTNAQAKTAANYMQVNQARTVRGMVLDAASGEPLPYAVVTVQGTTVGTVTDEGGNYTLEVPANQNYLQVKYVGYTTQRVTLNGDYHRILMASSGARLEETKVNTKVYLDGVSQSNVESISDREVSYGFNINGGRADAAGVVVETKKMRMAPNRMIGTMRGRRNMLYKTSADTYSGSSTQLNLAEVIKPVSVEFVLDELYTVKSTGKPMIVEMNNIRIDADFEYRSVPKLDEAAFLIAMIKDWTKYNFLEGEANLYFENTFVGKTVFDLTTLSDTLNISLGRDKSIQVKREKVKEYSGKKFIGSDRVEKRGYEIQVKNTKASPIRLVLYDQVPISNIEDISVDVTEISGAKRNEKTGELEWTIPIEAGAKVTRKIAYTVKFPKNRNVNVD